MWTSRQFSLILNIFFLVQEEQKELDEITAKRQKKGRNEEDAPAEEKTILHSTELFFHFDW